MAMALFLTPSLTALIRHDSTADQWFTDGQFTAYTALGRQIGERIRRAQKRRLLGANVAVTPVTTPHTNHKPMTSAAGKVIGKTTSATTAQTERLG